MRLGIDASNICVGGGINHLKELIRFVDVRKFNIEKIVIWSNKNTLKNIDEKPWLKKRSEPVFEKNFLMRAIWQHKNLSLELKKENCDILLVPGGSFTTTFRPVVTINQNLLPFELKEIFKYGISFSTLKFLLLRLSQSNSFKKASGTIFLSEFSKEIVLKITKSLNGFTTVIPHGIEKRFFLQKSEQLKINNFSNKNPFKLLYVSSIEPYKNHQQVIKAVAELRSRGVPLILELIGTAHNHTLISFKKKIKKVDPLCEFIHYLGFIPYEELTSYYKTADMIIFASSCETFGQTLLESMASGKPIVCSKKRPMSDILGDAGLYFDYESPKSISDTIQVLIESVDMRLKKSKLAVIRAKNYSWEKCTNETFSFLSKVLEKSYN